LASREAPVELVPYDPSWPARFEQEAAELRRLLAAWLVGRIEHIGSTAIPGLAAKPVIDIMAGVETLEASRPAIAALAPVGYCYAPYRADSEHWFCKPSPAFRTHHLHLMPVESARWREVIAFRDYLRVNSQVAAEYADLKQRLAQEHRFDREAYTEAKGPFIARIAGLAVPAACVLEHSVEAAVSATFAWRFWTNVTNWDDPPARFVLDGTFAEGSHGTTVLPGQLPLQWRIRRVRPGRSATIEMELDRATLGFEWHFDPLADRKTRLTQRLILSGDNSSAYAEQVRSAFGPNLSAGMTRLAATMARAERGGGR
jgi:GrpB-like predicted nucleotidyltransferase (UPF0157 family)